MQELVCDIYEFKSLDHAKEVFTDFYNTYNNERYLTCLLDYPPTKFIDLWNQGLIGQKEHKKKLIFFFKEEDKAKKQSPSQAISPPFEVNLVNNQDFVCSQNKDNVNLL